MLWMAGDGDAWETAAVRWKLEGDVGWGKSNQINSLGCKEGILTSPLQWAWKLNKCFVPLVNVPLYDEFNPTSGIQDPSKIKESKIFPRISMLLLARQLHGFLLHVKLGLMAHYNIFLVQVNMFFALRDSNKNPKKNFNLEVMVLFTICL